MRFICGLTQVAFAGRVSRDPTLTERRCVGPGGKHSPAVQVCESRAMWQARCVWRSPAAQTEAAAAAVSHCGWQHQPLSASAVGKNTKQLAQALCMLI